MIVVISEGSVTLSREEQFQKAKRSILVTLSGSSMAVNDEQELKAPSPIERVLEDSVICSSFLQFAKVYCSMEVTESGISIDVKLTLAKA